MFSLALWKDEVNIPSFMMFLPVATIVWTRPQATNTHFSCFNSTIKINKIVKYYHDKFDNNLHTVNDML